MRRPTEEQMAVAAEASLRKAQKLEREARLVAHARKNPDVTATDMAALFRVTEATASRLIKAARRQQ